MLHAPLHYRPAPALTIAIAAHGKRLLPGLGLCTAVGLAAIALGELPWFDEHGLSALVLALMLGMLLGNTVYPSWRQPCDAGVGLAKHTLLRAGIVLYGLRLTLQDVAHIGLAGLLVDAAMLCSTFALALWIGTRWLRLELATAVLIGAGSSICGAAAVLATGPVAKARADQVAVAVATVAVFGTLAVFVYPALHGWTQAWFDDAQAASRFFGLYIGSTVHEVAQVAAAGHGIGAQAADDAIVAKLMRVLMLAPFLMALSAWLAGRAPASAAPFPSAARIQGRSRHPRASLTIPWFAIAFMLVVAVHSAVAVPASLNQAAQALDTLLLATAMAALGLGTHHSALRSAGIKPLLLAALLFAWLVLGGGLINLLAFR